MNLIFLVHFMFVEQSSCGHVSIIVSKHFRTCVKIFKLLYFQAVELFLEPKLNYGVWSNISDTWTFAVSRFFFFLFLYIRPIDLHTSAYKLPCYCGTVLQWNKHQQSLHVLLFRFCVFQFYVYAVKVLFVCCFKIEYLVSLGVN